MSPSKLHPEKLEEVQRVVRWSILFLALFFGLLGYYFLDKECINLAVVITFVLYFTVKYVGLPFLLLGVYVGKSLHHTVYAVGFALVAGSYTRFLWEIGNYASFVVVFLVFVAAVAAGAFANDAIKKQYGD